MNKERYYHKLETIKESGNCRILREIGERDKLYYYKDRKIT